MDDFPPLQKVEFNLSYEMSVPFECDATEGVVYNLKSVLKLLQKAESIVLDSVAVEVYNWMYTIFIYTNDDVLCLHFVGYL